MDFFDAIEYIDNLAIQVESGADIKISISESISDTNLGEKKRKPSDQEYIIKTRSNRKNSPILSFSTNKLNIESNLTRKYNSNKILKHSTDDNDKENLIEILDSSESENESIFLEKNDDIFILNNVIAENDQNFNELIERSFLENVKRPRKTKKFGAPIRFSIEVIKVIFTKEELSNCIFVDTSRIYPNLKRRNFDKDKTNIFKNVLKVHYNMSDERFEKFWKKHRGEINKQISTSKF